MANYLYDKGAQAILAGEIDLLTDDVYVVLCSASYTPNKATHQTLADLAGIVATAGPLTGKSCAGGVFDADDITFTGLTGSVVTQIILYQQSSTSPVTTRLVCRIDTASGLPLTPSGADEVINWSNGGSKIFDIRSA